MPRRSERIYECIIINEESVARNSTTFNPKTTRSLKWTNRLIDSKEFNDRRLTSRSATCHLPKTNWNKYSKIQLHKWCLKDSLNDDFKQNSRQKKGLLKCPNCTVILCLDCYTLFQTVHSLHKMKARVTKDKIDKPLVFLG